MTLENLKRLLEHYKKIGDEKKIDTYTKLVKWREEEIAAETPASEKKSKGN